MKICHKITRFALPVIAALVLATAFRAPAVAQNQFGPGLMPANLVPAASPASR